MIKIDVFIVKSTAYHQTAFKRRKKDKLDEEESSSNFYLTTPEDIILLKLEWYRMGGEVSERQWLDILMFFIISYLQNLLLSCT